MLSPSYQKNRSAFQEKSPIGQPLSHYNMANEIGTDKENVSSSALNLTHALPVTDISLESGVPSRDNMVKEGVEYNATRVEDYSRFMPYTAYNFMAYRQRAQLNNCGFNTSTKSEGMFHLVH